MLYTAPLRSLIPLLLAAVLAAQAAWSIATTSGSYDESTYLHIAREAYDRGTCEPFAESGVAPLPVFIEYAIPTIYQPGYVASITIARAMTVLLIGLPLIFVVYAWLAREAGVAAAATAAALVALSPNIVANVSIATTDAAAVLFALLALFALSAWLEAPSPKTFIGLAVAVAAAMAAKYSAVGLFAVVPLSVLACRIRASKQASIGRASLTAAGVTAALLATTFIALWALHGFGDATANVPGIGWTRMPGPLAGILYQINHQRGGHFSFLFGTLSTSGWWYYMPVALALKSTPIELLMFAAGFIAVPRRWRTCSASGLVWRVAVVVYGVLALVNRVDAGVRYILLIIPLLLLIALEHRFRDGSAPRWLRPAAVALILAQAASSVLIGPHYLSYFNVFAGGPSAGHRYLADSNIDWGQDLPALRDTLERVGARRPVLVFWGTAPRDAYGIAAFEWTSGPLPANQGFDWIAISSTSLNGAYSSHDAFEGFRSLVPSARAAYSIFLYEIRRPEVQQAIATASARMSP